MAIIERGGRFGLRVQEDGQRKWLGTFSTREEAEDARATYREAQSEAQREATRRRLRREAGIRERSTEAKDRDSTVYRCYAEDGTLLYVGLTTQRFRRFYEHADKKDWWSQVVRLELTHFASDEEARDAEARMIRSLRPLHNIDFRPNHDEKIVQLKRCRRCGCAFVPPLRKRPRRKTECNDCFRAATAEEGAA